MGKPLMIQGTASGVGKTILTTALCRIFRQDGYSVAPFKSQNMTSNTATLETGEELAISQILQAEAAGIVPCAAMNPIVLKPSPDIKGVQLILNGKLHDSIDAYELDKQSLVKEIKKAYEALSSQYDIIVIEGAGSPVELNLNKDDIVNMGIAKLAKAPVLLVSDIDRGGVFASLYGTVALMSEWERSHVKATIVNRFRGEVSYFKDGVNIIEEITGVPVAGIVPYIELSLPEEDELGSGSYSRLRTQPEALRKESEYTLDSSREDEYDLIADHVRKSLNMELIYKILNG